MRHRLAMGRPPQPHSASSIVSVTTSASPVESHPRAGRKTPRAPPESTPATPSIGQPAETFPQSSPATDKDKRKKRKRKEDDASPRRPKKHKKRTSPVASSDTEIYENPIVNERRGLCQCTTSRVLRLSSRGTLHQPLAILKGRRVLPNPRRFPRAIANELLFPCKYFKNFSLTPSSLYLCLLNF